MLAAPRLAPANAVCTGSASRRAKLSYLRPHQSANRLAHLNASSAMLPHFCSFLPAVLCSSFVTFFYHSHTAFRRKLELAFL